MRKTKKPYSGRSTFRLQKTTVEKRDTIKSMEAARINHRVTDDQLELILIDCFHQLASIRHNLKCQTNTPIGDNKYSTEHR